MTFFTAIIFEQVLKNTQMLLLLLNYSVETTYVKGDQSFTYALKYLIFFTLLLQSYFNFIAVLLDGIFVLNQRI